MCVNAKGQEGGNAEGKELMGVSYKGSLIALAVWAAFQEMQSL